jgi:pseudouridine kinase
MDSDRFETVTVFGGATLDRIAFTDSVPVMGASNPGSIRRGPGGVAFNVATTLAQLGLRVRLVTRVGADPDGEAIIAAAIAAGVDTNALGVSPATATGAYHACCDEAGNLIVGVADMKICDEILPPSLAALAIARRERDLWVVDANLPAETIEFLAGEAMAAGRPLAALTVSPAKARKLIPVLDRVAYLFTNRREAVALLGLATQEAAAAGVADLARALAARRATSVIVTDGPNPLALAADGDVRSFAPPRAAVRGVNGAGDSLAAGTITGLAAGASLRDAIRQGISAAVMTLEAGSVAAARLAPGVLGARPGAGARIAS